MASIEQNPLDTTQALYNPTSAVLIELETANLSTGLWKIGSCYEDQLGTRPRSTAQYNPVYFDRGRPVCLCYGLVDTAHAALLETACIRHAKFDLMTGVNTKSKDDTPHDGYCARRPGALYAVPVRSDVATTQAGFKVLHVSYYMDRTHGKTTKEERAAAKEERAAAKRAPGGAIFAKRAKLVKEYIDKIPMKQLERAFSGRNALNDLVVSYNFKSVNSTIFNEMKLVINQLRD